ncbi:MAG: hypothetical protein Q7262_02185 [Bacteroidales bacterium]|nr:hypothetical protein [Bacteroidales bacterium]
MKKEKLIRKILLPVAATTLCTILLAISPKKNGTGEKGIQIYREGQEIEITQKEMEYILNEKIPSIIKKISMVIQDTTQL